MMKRYALSFLFLSLLVAIAVLPASAGTVYSSGPVNGNFGAWGVSGTIDMHGTLAQVTDTFTVAAGTEGDLINGVTFAAWFYPGDTMSNIDWSIGTTPYGTQDGTGTATTTLACIAGLCPNTWDYNVDNVSFSTTNVYLAPGTYYLTLWNGTVTGGDPALWDENDGSSTGETNWPVAAGEGGLIGAWDCANSYGCGLSGGRRSRWREPFCQSRQAFCFWAADLRGWQAC